jgi:hypothetical protein
MVELGLKPRHTKGFFDLTPQRGLKHKICEDLRYYFGQFLEKKGVKCGFFSPGFFNSLNLFWVKRHKF